MNSVTDRPAFERPFPALTGAQRLHLETLGYVIVPDVLSSDECDTIRESLQRIRRELRAPSRERLEHEPFALINQEHHVYMGSILQADGCLTACATHPKLVGMAEELLGGEARILEFNAHINSRIPGDTFDDEPTFGLHRGVDVPFGSHYKNGLYHCNFVKTLTMLTDLGEDDGGTVVIAGSHKLDLPDGEMIAAAYADRSMLHQVVAPAGSSLLFAETLMHATGQIRSDRERAIIICGYGASLYPWWDGGVMNKAWKAAIPPQFQTLLTGRAHWTRGPRYRTLSEPQDPRTFTLRDGYWPAA